MNSRHLVRLFLSTLLVGGITAGIVGFLVRWDEFMPLFENADIVGILSTFVWLVGVGLIFSVISQMSFFAYLTVHRFGIGIFKNLWSAVQLVVIAFILFDLVYFRYIAFEDGEGLGSYIALAGFVLAVGIIVAFIKVKQTNKQAFIPALFFMTVVTVLQWVPVLVENDQGWLYFMLLTLLVCNSYQLLTLHKINEKSAEEIKRKQSKSNHLSHNEISKA